MRYSPEVKEARTKWAQDLATALNTWFEERHYSDDDKFGFRDTVGAKIRDWSRIVRGEGIIGDDSVYTKLHQQTGLAEADPITIPKSPEAPLRMRRISMARSPDMSKKDPRLVVISEKLKDWMENNEYRTYNKLAQELDVKPADVGKLIRAEGYANPSVMARLYWRTDIAELDPRTIPPKRQTLPRSTEVMWIPRAWTEEDYQIQKEAWEESQLQPASVSSDDELPQEPEVPEPEEVYSPPEEEVVQPPPPRTTSIGSIIDSFISVFALQIGGHIADRVTDQVSGDLQEIAKAFPTRNDIQDAVLEVIEVFTAPTSPPKQQQGSVSSLSLKELIREITQRFESLKNASREERDTLVYELGNELGDLYAAIVPFTLDGNARERSLETERKHHG